MPCWPDLWDHIEHLLPLAATLAISAAFIAIVVLLLWAPKLRKRWQRITSRVVGMLAALPLVFLLVAMLFGAMYMSNPPTQTRVVRSHAGLEARVNYSAGFLGRDYTEVTVKIPGCCRHIRVFSHAGPSWFDDMKMEWLDEHQLHLTYHARPEDPQHCEQHVGQIRIVCTSLTWPNREK